jgi:hypothetical protein
MVHLCSPWLHQHVNPVLGHTLVVAKAGGTRGVVVRDFSSLQGKNGVALASPYAGPISRAYWEENVSPYLDTIVAQQPLSAYLVQESRPSNPTAIGRPISAAAFCGLAAIGSGGGMMQHLAALGAQEPQSYYDALESESPAVVTDLALIETSDASLHRVTLPLYVDADKIPYLGEAKTKGLITALEQLKSAGTIVAYSFLHHRILHQCNDTIQLILALPVV